MKKNLERVLTYIGEEFSSEITHSSRFYRMINIGEQAEKLGLSDVREKYAKSDAMLLLKKPVAGMKVRIDGRTFKDYTQFDNGVVVPGHIARKTGLSHKDYTAQDSMVLVFA